MIMEASSSTILYRINTKLFHIRFVRVDFSDPGMRSVFVNPETGDVWKEGELYTNLALANTLHSLADEGDRGDHSFYNGTISHSLLHDIKQLGNIFREIFPDC